MKKLLFIAILLLFLISCKKESQEQRAVYFWKTKFDFTQSDSLLLTQTKISKIYLRLFDLDFDSKKQSTTLVAPLIYINKPPHRFNYVPVIYITNKVIKNCEDFKINELGQHILKKINSMCEKGDITYNEVQIDCDWSEGTRDKYFRLLSYIKNDLNNQNKIVSATIRLHQIKYAEITGIPPVDRGMLMYYNMGKIESRSEKNSIFNEFDAKKYTKHISYYPLPLDLALPVFSWGIQMRSDRIIALLNNFTANDLNQKDKFKALENNKYVTIKSFFYKGYYFMKDDIIKLDEIKPKNVNSAIKLVLPFFKNKQATIALYHYNALITNGYEKDDIKRIYNNFN